MSATTVASAAPRVVSRAEWLAARKEHLRKEKELTRLRDQLSRERRALPCVKIDKPYRFTGPGGEVPLAGLFAGRSQLFVYHFMFGPDWDEGCKSCSMVVDHLAHAAVHLAQRDVTVALVSRAPWAKIEGFQRRMGWRLPWFSSHGSDFNFDFSVSFTPEEIALGKPLYNYGTMPPYMDEVHGASVFCRDEAGQVFHTYSTYGRGAEPMVVPYFVLDLVPKGRDEDALEFSMAWVRHHDRYDSAGG